MKISKHVDPNLKYQFCDLRAQVLGNCLYNVWLRLDEQKKIIPTKEEIRLTTIWELIEPQVRDAVKVLIKKGYCTTDSGFSGDEYSEQFISGLFSLDESTTKLLESKGVTINEDGRWTYIRFIPTNPDLDEITQTWGEIVELLPDLGSPAKSFEEIFHHDEDKIMQKLYELGKIEELPNK